MLGEEISEVEDQKLMLMKLCSRALRSEDYALQTSISRDTKYFHSGYQSISFQQRTFICSEISWD
jgi:hypothetical protein